MLRLKFLQALASRVMALPLAILIPFLQGHQLAAMAMIAAEYFISLRSSCRCFPSHEFEFLEKLFPGDFRSSSFCYRTYRVRANKI